LAASFVSSLILPKNIDTAIPYLLAKHFDQRWSISVKYIQEDKGWEKKHVISFEGPAAEAHSLIR
jgi:hypothetical protein